MPASHLLESHSRPNLAALRFLPAPGASLGGTTGWQASDPATLLKAETLTIYCP